LLAAPPQGNPEGKLGVTASLDGIRSDSLLMPRCIGSGRGP
jgi:hypothetical protein